MEGYIVLSEDHLFLTQRLFWYPHDRLEEARVHSREEIEHIRTISVDWGKKPAVLVSATWTQETGTVVTGNPIPF